MPSALPELPAQPLPDTAVAQRLMALAKAQGFTGEEAIVMTAIGLAESGGRAGARRNEGADDSYGIWQVNMLGALGPDRRHRPEAQRERAADARRDADGRSGERSGHGGCRCRT